jgi:hypothetical protein
MENLFAYGSLREEENCFYEYSKGVPEKLLGYEVKG